MTEAAVLGIEHDLDPPVAAPCVRAVANSGAARVGVLGCGTVGAAVVRRLHDDGVSISGYAGADVSLASVALRHAERPRNADLSGCRVTTDPWTIAIDPAIDVVVEVIGGIEPARELVLAALGDGKSVVTANKQLIAAHGDELTAVARARGVQLRYDAAVGGGTPVLAFVKALRHHGVQRIDAVLNGTTNYILGRMGTDGLSLGDALVEARQLGFAESDARFDLEGRDSAAKAAIIAASAFGRALDGAPIACEGITSVTADVIRAADALGRSVKLIAVIERAGGRVDVRVGPSALPVSHPLARLRGCDNGVTCTTRTAGELTVTGPGAGGDATAGAIVSDIAQIVSSYRASGIAEPT
jgi:homoserine dehydrogenase